MNEFMSQNPTQLSPQLVAETPEERMRSLKAYGFPGKLRVKDGQVQLESTVRRDAWDAI